MACKGLKKDGTPCNFRPAAGQEFCINHGGTKPAKPAAKAEAPAAKTAPKAAPASRSAHAGDGLGVAAGIVVGLGCAAALAFYAYRRFWPAAKQGAQSAAGRPTLAAVPGI